MGPGVDPVSEEVLTRDRSSGRLHKRIRTTAGLVPFGGESDNLDDAGEYDVVTADAIDTAEAGDLCERCFPSHQDGQAG